MSQQGQIDFTAKFSGPDLTEKDHIRLSGQIQRVFDILCDHRRRDGWWTVPEVCLESQTRFDAHDPEPSVSAQIRNLRKAAHGGYKIERRRRAGSEAVCEFRISLDFLGAR